MQPSISFSHPATVVAQFHGRMHDLDHEEVWGVFLNRKNHLISEMMLSKGTLTQTSIDNRTVLRNALLLNAEAIILLHNHPSGNAAPSAADIQFTGSLRKACSLFDIRLLDHIIVAEKSYFSFAQETTTKL